MPILYLVICVLLIVFFVSSIRIIKEHQRAAIFRLGQFIAVAGPGLIVLIPVVDKAKMIDLDQLVPGWQGLSKTELDDKVKSVALSGTEN